MGSLDLQGIAVVRAKMCTDTPLVPARLHAPICLVVPAWHPPCACLGRRTGPPSSAPYCHAILSSARVSCSRWESTHHTAWRPGNRGALNVKPVSWICKMLLQTTASYSGSHKILQKQTLSWYAKPCTHLWRRFIAKFCKSEKPVLHREPPWL
jgi:hypothetical protein